MGLPSRHSSGLKTSFLCRVEIFFEHLNQYALQVRVYIKHDLNQ